VAVIGCRAGRDCSMTRGWIRKLVVCLGLLGVIMFLFRAVWAPYVVRLQTESMISRTRSDMRLMATALKAYNADEQTKATNGSEEIGNEK